MVSGVPAGAEAAVLEVGPGKRYAKPCAAIAAAQPGDTIRIDARGNGTYDGDVCDVRTARLTIEGVRGRARIAAAGRSSGGKGIWVISGPDTVVRNVELTGAAVPDRNGAGIRLEGEGDLRLERSSFHGNENGILVTASATESDVVVDSTSFAGNGAGDGYSHNIYVARARSFTMRYSASRGARRGHLVKTRARRNAILFNRLAGEGSTSSYELDIPDGGVARVVGNVVQQGPQTENATLLAFGEESLANPNSRLTLAHNTFVSGRRGPATAVRVGGDGAVPVTAVNDLVTGVSTYVDGGGKRTLRGTCTAANPRFVAPARFDFRLRTSSPCRDAGVRKVPGGVPREQYVRDLRHERRTTAGRRPDAGAFEIRRRR